MQERGSAHRVDAFVERTPEEQRTYRHVHPHTDRLMGTGEVTRDAPGITSVHLHLPTNTQNNELPLSVGCAVRKPRARLNGSTLNNNPQDDAAFDHCCAVKRDVRHNRGSNVRLSPAACTG